MTGLIDKLEGAEDVWFSGFTEGWGTAFIVTQGPRVRRPDGITDDQWVTWYGAKRLDDGRIVPPMSVAHLIPTGKNTKTAKPWYRDLMRREEAAILRARQSNGDPS